MCKEALFWLHLDHPNVLPILGIHQTLYPIPFIGLVTPWMRQGHLIDFLQGKVLDDAFIFRLVRTI